MSPFRSNSHREKQTPSARARDGTVGLARVEATVGLAAAELAHLRWWLDWHTRSRPTIGCREQAPEPEPGRPGT